MAVQARDIEVAGGAHAVKFYEHDAELVAAVGPYLAAAIHAQEVALVIATEPHRRAFESALEAHGVEVESAKASGRLVSLDAATTISEFYAAGKIDDDAFRGLIGGVLRAAAAAGRPLRAFGEMVALLWDAGDVVAAIALEKLWHELGRELPFTLLCSYPTASVAAAGHAQALAQVCHLHCSVLSPAAVHGTPSAATCAQTGTSAPFDVDPDSPGRARRLVVDTLRRWGAPNRLVDDVALLVSELATNAVRHADSSFSVTVRASGSTLRVAVHDGAALAGTLSEAWLIPQPLHGLSLVDALCTRWGVEDTRHGKLVWAELPYEGTVVPEARS
jgi:hypothetical protein